MTHNHDERAGAPGEETPEYDTNPFDTAKRQQRGYTDFDEDDGHTYEEPDRDTDYTSGFQEESLEDDEFDDFLTEDDLDDGPPLATDSQAGPAQAWGGSAPGASTQDEPWSEQEEYPLEEESSSPSWPLGLIAVAAVALVLLIAGGYGVMQQRSATQDEIRQLRAALATAVSPEDMNASRTAVHDLKRENSRLAVEADALRTRNRRLTSTVAELEARLDAQPSAPGKVGAAGKPAPAGAPTSPEPAPAAAIRKPLPAKAPAATARKPIDPVPAGTAPAERKPVASIAATAQKPATATGVSWFVNFSSYGQRATAETWKARLQPASGKVIVAPSAKDGTTYYRVRVIDLPSRESAEQVAQALEKQHGLPKLWIGKQ